MTDWINGFFVPLIQILFLTAFFGGLAIFIFRGIYIRWSRYGQFFLKYKLLKKKYDEKDLKWILNCMEKDMSVMQVRKTLLLSNTPDEKIKEIVFIYWDINNQMKGGKKADGRKFERSFSEIEKYELPELK